MRRNFSLDETKQEEEALLSNQEQPGQQPVLSVPDAPKRSDYAQSVLDEPPTAPSVSSTPAAPTKFQDHSKGIKMGVLKALFVPNHSDPADPAAAPPTAAPPMHDKNALQAMLSGLFSNNVAGLFSHNLSQSNPTTSSPDANAQLAAIPTQEDQDRAGRYAKIKALFE